MKRLRVKPYPDESTRWPEQGHVILAQYDAETVVVYQAYSRATGHWVAQRGRLGGPGFSLDRMSWLKTSFLWLMHRSAWGTAPGQEAVFAIWLRRDAFDALLAQAVPSRYIAEVYASREAWQAAVDASDVRAQWDPDYPPHGPKLRRRAIQLGLRGEALRCFVEEWTVQVEDISGFVRQQARYARRPELLFVPAQRVYPVRDPEVARRLDLDKSVPD